MSLIDAKNFDDVITFSKSLSKTVVVTRGEKGAVAVNGDEVVECGIKEGLKIVDLTGAGDLFAGGFLHGHVNKMSLKDSLEKGTEIVVEGYSTNRCKTLNIIFSFKTPFTFFGLTTRGLYFLEKSSLATLFFFHLKSTPFCHL